MSFREFFWLMQHSHSCIARQSISYWDSLVKKPSKSIWCSIKWLGS